ncbi:hypothetical protein EMCRGX_G029293 [Ephydatia muelleri]
MYMLGPIPLWALYGGSSVLLLATPILLFSLYVAHIHWKYSHIPSPKRASFFLGHIPDFVAMKKQRQNEFLPLADVVLKWTAEVGNLFVIFIGLRPFVISNNPEDIKLVAADEGISKPSSFYKHLASVAGQRFMGSSLLTIADYPTWKPRRKLYDHTFKRSSLKELVPQFNECVAAFLDNLRLHADGMTEVPMKEAFHNLTLSFISKVGFSSDFNQLWDCKSLGLKYATESKLSCLASISFVGVQRQISDPLFKAREECLCLLHPLEARVYRECAASMGRIGRDCIEKRIKAVTTGGEVPNDILTQILQISCTDTSVDMETLVDDFVTFYVAGQETTANALSFAVILIHQHPEVLDKLLSEIEDVLGDRKEVTGDDLDKLKYTEQVIQEVLRMYPTVIRMIKESPRGGLELSGYHIPEGASISFFTAVMSRNPAFFNDPDTFDPSRFDVDKPR